MSKFADYPTNVTVAGNSISFLYKAIGINDAVNVGVVNLDEIGASLDDINFNGETTNAELKFGHVEGSTSDFDYSIYINYVPYTEEYPDVTDSEYLKVLDCNGLNVYAYGVAEGTPTNYYEYFVTLTGADMYWKIRLTVEGTYTDHATDTVVPNWVSNCIDAFKMWINGMALTTTNYPNTPAETVTHTVEFYNVAGTHLSETYPDQTVEDGGLATEPSPEPEQDGYGFSGWYVGYVDYGLGEVVITGETPWDFTSDTVTTDLVLVSKFEAVGEE